MNKPRVQVTLIQIDNYGPWTTTLGDDREHRLQILQAELYAGLQRYFAAKNALVFFNRFDEMFAITNGVSIQDHKEIQNGICELFPFTVSMSIGVDVNPFGAQFKASRLMQMAGSAQSEHRKRALNADETIRIDDAYAQVVHIDVDGITNLTDHGFALQTSQTLLRSHLDLMTIFSQLESLLFYLGGDNFMAITPELSKEIIAEKLHSHPLSGLPLKFGLGRAQTARKAAELATMNLEQIRLGRERNHCVSPHLRESR